MIAINFTLQILSGYVNSLSVIKSCSKTESLWNSANFWPSTRELDALDSKSAISFVFPATCWHVRKISFVQHSHHISRKQLAMKVLVALPDVIDNTEVLLSQYIRQVFPFISFFHFLNVTSKLNISRSFMYKFQVFIKGGHS